MHCRTLLSRVVAVTLLLGVAQSFAADPPQTSKTKDDVPADVPTLKTEDFIRPTPKLDGPLANDTAEIMQEIMSIRKMFGDLIEGTDLGKSVVPNTSETNEEKVADPSFANLLKQAIQTNSQFTPAPPANAIPPQAPRGDEHVIAMLRGMCRQLSEQAEELEERRSYVQADQLRGLAHQIRMQARAFEQLATYPATPPCPVYPHATQPYITPATWIPIDPQPSIAPPLPIRPPLPLPSVDRSRSAPAEKAPTSTK